MITPSDPDHPMPDAWVVDVRIGTRSDGSLRWDPVCVQMEVDRFEEAQWRARLAEAFAAGMVVKPFKWAGQGVILLDFKLNNVVAKAVYDLGCAGVAISQYFVKKMGLKPIRVVPLTLLSADGVTTIDRSVFDEVNIKWKTTDVDLPAIVLPGAGFDLLLGLTWIVKAGVGLDAERLVLVLRGQEHPFEIMSVPEPPKGVVTTVI